jgi:hypothetical protein
MWQAEVMLVRRVVTGHSAEGKSVVVSDGPTEPVQLSLMPGADLHRLWGADEVPRFPDRGEPPPAHDYFPPPGGVRFAFFTVPPGSQRPPADLDLGAALQEVERKMPGAFQYHEATAPGMHTTPTLDFEVVLVGEVWMELDDKVVVHLRAGDTVVQNGTRHAWRNHTDQPAVLAVFLAGAGHDRLGVPSRDVHQVAQATFHGRPG